MAPNPKNRLVKVSGLLVLILMIIGAISILDAAEDLKIEFKQGLITAEIKNIPFEQVLSEMQKKTGVKINVMGSPIVGNKATLSIKNAKPEYFLKTLLGENYAFLFKQNLTDKSYILKEVWVASRSLRSSTRITAKEIGYGSGRENIGVLRGAEGGSMGPASFAVDSKGNIYISDTVNNRIQILSPQGKFVSSTQYQGQRPEDISTDKNGFIYVYDVEGTLYQYDSTGNPVSELPVDETRWGDSKGPMHIIDNSVYVRGSGKGDVLIAHIENGKLVPPSDQELQESLQDGVLGLTGKRYVGFLQEDDGAAIEVIETDGTKSLRVIPVQGIVSVEFLGEDGKGNSYVKTEADNSGELFIAVSRFDVNGNYLDTITIPGNSYDFWAIRQVAVGEDGTLYQMMPTEDKLILNSFTFN